jgi:hypothetical protein
MYVGFYPCLPPQSLLLLHRNSTPSLKPWHKVRSIQESPDKCIQRNQVRLKISLVKKFKFSAKLQTKVHNISNLGNEIIPV